MPAGVRQGCALGLAMSKWRFANPQGGIGLGDRVRRLLDLRFADDILIFAYRKDKVQNVVDSLVDIWQRRVGTAHFEQPPLSFTLRIGT